MDKAHALYKEGKLGEAIQTLKEQLFSAPLDTQSQIFLFELLCFAGNWDEAEAQLEFLGGSNPLNFGGFVYGSALHAERARQLAFERKEIAPPPTAGSIVGSLNGKAFLSISDADPRIGPNLEVFSGGGFVTVPIRHLLSLEMGPPKLLRDLLWAPARIRTSRDFAGVELRDVFLPVLYPMSWRHEDDEVKLGRMTVWEPDAEYRELPFGQKMLLVDHEEVPLLEVRKLEIFPSQMVN